ncbi:MAG TPA: asparagine synthase-related protein [Candidatus Binatia bacterium]|nr:asparagine synthase-related protein [Candidatus Binatia bacterium]
MDTAGGERAGVSGEVQAALDAAGTALAGRIRFGADRTFALHRRPVGRLWAEVVTLDDGFRFAVDGYLVRDGRLRLGEGDEARSLATAFRGDPAGFMAGLENACCNLVGHDPVRRVTVIANDAMGCLPLYLHRGKDGIAFANDLPGLRAIATEELTRDPVGCAELYWFGYQIGSRTIWRDVECIPPGALLTIDWQTGAITATDWRGARPQAGAGGASSPEANAQALVAAMQTACRRLHVPERRYAIKLSGGMDSRLVAGSWPEPNLAAFTFTAPRAIEARITGRLARALGMPLHVSPLEGDFFSRLHGPFFAKHAITEFFHQALIEPMAAAGIDCALDGLGGDVLFGGLALKRKGGAKAALRNALGMAGPSLGANVSDAEAAEIIFSQIRVGDGTLRVMGEAAQQEIETCRAAVLQDIAAEFARCAPGAEFDRRYRAFAIRNRMRRYIALQGAVCRPQVETLYPFLDHDVQAMAERIGSAMAAGKKFYRLLYRRNLPRIARVPFVDSLLPPGAPNGAHVLGRIARYGVETASYRASVACRRDLPLWRINSMQWPRWIAFDPPFIAGIGRFMAQSPAFDAARFAAAIAAVRRGRPLAGTRIMLTASYLGLSSLFKNLG